MRIVIAEDSALVREGLSLLLSRAGHQVVAAVSDAEALKKAAVEQRPDLVVTDIRMPPDFSDDGVRAARDLRRLFPELPVMLLSQHIETTQSTELVSSGGFGYLLKDRVLDLDDFLSAVDRVAAGGSALDPEVVGALLRKPELDPAFASLTDREKQVLALIAEGHSNGECARRLSTAERTVESHVRSIFVKLGLYDEGSTNRRVLAVLVYLRNSS